MRDEIFTYIDLNVRILAYTTPPPCQNVALPISTILSSHTRRLEHLSLPNFCDNGLKCQPLKYGDFLLGVLGKMIND
jgi:hypothetical protein